MRDHLASSTPGTRSRPPGPAGVPILAGGAALAALLLLAGCGDSAPAQAEGPRARPVQVVTVALAPREAEKRFVGVVRARREIDLAFRVPGKVTQRLVGIGDRIAPGTVVARIDPEDLKLELQSAEAELSAAKANLSQNSAEDERARSLTAKGFASAAELDRKALAKEEAVGRLERAKRSLELAQNRLSYAELVSDQAGVVIATSVEPGQVVATGQTIVRVARLEEKEALVALPEIDLADARTAPAVMELWAVPGKAYPVKLRELSPQADATSRTYPARFTILDPDERVTLGMTATVTLHPKDQAKVARLPLSSVIDKGRGPLVFVVEGDASTLAERKVDIAAYTDAEVLVAAGLKDGDRVVTLGVQTLEPGQAVRTVPVKGQLATAGLSGGARR